MSYNVIIKKKKMLTYNKFYIIFHAGGDIINDFLTVLQKQFYSTQFTIMVILIVCDIATGLLVSTFEKSKNTKSGKIESKYLRTSIIRKIGYLILYWVCVVIDYFTKQNLLSNLCAVLIIGSDGLSIVENLGLLGVPIPKQLKNILGALKSKGDDEK